MSAVVVYAGFLVAAEFFEENSGPSPRVHYHTTGIDPLASDGFQHILSKLVIPEPADPTGRYPQSRGSDSDV